MQYVFLVYLDETKFARMTGAERDRWVAAMEAYDEELMGSGNLLHAAALRMPKEASTIRIRDSVLTTTDGPFAETKEHLSGLFLVSAIDMNDAIRLAGNMPLAKVGSIEVRPIKNHPGEA